MPENEEEKIIKVPRFKKENGFETTPERSRLMAKIKGKDTKPEILLRKAIWAAGLRYRLHNKKLPGSPDIVFKKYKLVVFIDGEFWHGFDWEKKRNEIKTNKEFWIAKIERNMQRDKANSLKLEEMGFKVFRFWGKDVKKNLNGCLASVEGFIKEVRVKKKVYITDI